MLWAHPVSLWPNTKTAWRLHDPLIFGGSLGIGWGPWTPKCLGSFPGCPKPLPVEIELSFKQSEQEGFCHISGSSFPISPQIGTPHTHTRTHTHTHWVGSTPRLVEMILEAWYCNKNRCSNMIWELKLDDSADHVANPKSKHPSSFGRWITGLWHMNDVGVVSLIAAGLTRHVSRKFEDRFNVQIVCAHTAEVSVHMCILWE